MAKIFPKRLTDLELSKVLTAHANDQLRRFGGLDWEFDGYFKKCYGCINQFRFNEPDNVAARLDDEAWANWFDLNYVRLWDEEEFLTELELVPLEGYVLGENYEDA